MMNDVIGKTIGRYQIVEHLGRGGMAEVYKAYQASLDRYVAVKLMHTFLAEDPEFYARFEREAKNIAALRHPSIIQIHDFDRDGATYYMVMEFIDGGTLKDRLQALSAKGESLPLNEAISIIKDIGAALAFAHSAGMIHRDIKPANVLLDRRGRVILTDFGIAKMVSSAKFTASGSLLGTPAYMAPEQGLGQPGDNRADIYSLGVMFYQLVTGQLPYEADTPVAVILKHVNEAMVMPRTLKPDLPLGVERIIAKAMAKDVNQRYQNIDDLLRDLNNLDKAALMNLPEATMIAPKAAPGGPLPSAPAPAGEHATLLTTAGGLATNATTPKKESGFNALPVVIGGILVLFLLALGIIGVIAAPQLLASLQSSSPTPFVITVLPNQTLPANLPPEVIAGLTQQAATAIAINGINAANQTAIAQLQATDTLAPTPNLTATFVACTFDASVTKITPSTGANLTLNKANPISIEIQNNGNCAWDNQTTFVLDSGAELRPTGQRNTFVPAAAPGDKVVIDLVFQPTESKTFASKWIIRLTSGRAVGQPFALSYKSQALATSQNTPRVIASSTPSGPTATPFISKGLAGASLRFQSCNYSGSDYTCSVAVIIDGGVPVWNVAISGANDGQFTWDIGDARFWQMVAPRCEAVTIKIVVIDSNNDQVENTVTFDPNATPIFPGGATCSLS